MQKLNLFQCHVCDFVGITAHWSTTGFLPDPKASEVMGRPQGHRFRKTILIWKTRDLPGYALVLHKGECINQRKLNIRTTSYGHTNRKHQGCIGRNSSLS